MDMRQCDRLAGQARRRNDTAQRHGEKVNVENACVPKHRDLPFVGGWR